MGKINLMPNREKAIRLMPNKGIRLMPNKGKEKTGFLEDSLKILFGWLSKIIKILWEYLKKTIKRFKKEYF